MAPSSLAVTSTSVTTINVDAGSVVLSGNSNYPNAKVVLDSGTILDMRGTTNLQLGSVEGSGTIKNFSPSTGGTLVTGADGTNATFDGTLASDYTSGLFGVTKIGGGNWTLAADNSANLLGTLTVNDGTVILDGAVAKVGFVTSALARRRVT